MVRGVFVFINWQIIVMTFAILSLLDGRLFAEEVDDFVRNNSKLPSDSTVGINKLINDSFKLFAEKYSSSNTGCDRKELVESILYFFDRNFSGVGQQLRDHSMSNAGIAYMSYGSHRMKIGGFTIGSIKDEEEGKDINVYQDTSVFCCTDSVNVNGHLIGIDKIDHFFGNGGLLWSKFEDSYFKSEEKIIKMSQGQEEGAWGLSGFKVKSYGDLASNWDGFTFFKEIIDGSKPYLSCRDGKIKILREFDIKDYIKSSWRESANCSAFANKELAVKFAANLRKKNITCPQDPQDCEKIIDYYKKTPKLLSSIVSPVCLRKIKIEDSVEQPGPVSAYDLLEAAGGLRIKDVQEFIKGKQ